MSCLHFVTILDHIYTFQEIFGKKSGKESGKKSGKESGKKSGKIP